MRNTPPKDIALYQYSLIVKEKHIDNLNHVNNMVYLQWVNEMSEKHWAILSNDEINKKYSWFCIRHEIDYASQAFLGNEVTIYTWIGKTKGVRSVRYVHIYNEDVLLAKTESTWCLMNAKTLKPTQIGDDVLELLIPNNS